MKKHAFFKAILLEKSPNKLVFVKDITLLGSGRNQICIGVPTLYGLRARDIYKITLEPYKEEQT